MNLFHEIITYSSFFSSGCHHGVIRRFEEKRGGPVTWIVCLKHGNEKTWGRYFHYCDACGGPKNTKSPGFDGFIGSQFHKDGIYKDPIVNYDSFPNSNVHEMPEDYVKSMNSDYQTLYELWIATARGPESFSKALADRTIGVCHQARYV